VGVVQQALAAYRGADQTVTFDSAALERFVDFIWSQIGPA